MWAALQAGDLGLGNAPKLSKRDCMTIGQAKASVARLHRARVVKSKHKLHMAATWKHAYRSAAFHRMELEENQAHCGMPYTVNNVDNNESC